jgi:hypothetical protein
MGREPGAAVMSALEGRAEAEAGTFNAQAVANTLWAYATMGREPGAAVMSELEGRAEAVEGTFNTQNVANTLRAYAKMGRVPEEGLMRALEGRAKAEAGTCNAQAVANTLWAACVFSLLRAPAGEIQWVYTVAQRLVSLDKAACFNTAQLCQLHQFFVWCSGAGASCGGDQGHAIFERDMSCGVGGHTDISVSDPQATERDAAPHGTVGGGRGSLPKVRVFYPHDRA